MFGAATVRVDLTTPYFVPDYRTQHRLIEAALRGVEVRLLVPAKSDVPLARTPAWTVAVLDASRQAIMLEGAGNSKHIVCPIHRWTYDPAGHLIGAPHFPSKPNFSRTIMASSNS